MESAVHPNVDLLRSAAFALDALERSPPEPIILGLADFSAKLRCSPEDLAAALERLVDLRLIEGPGALQDCWLFRRITPRGRVFLDETRNEGRWSEIKRAYSAPGQ
jgi:hypothetical protein